MCIYIKVKRVFRHKNGLVSQAKCPEKRSSCGYAGKLQDPMKPEEPRRWHQ